MELNVIEKTLRPDYYCKQTHLTKRYVGLSPYLFIFRFVHEVDNDYLSEWEINRIRFLTRDYSIKWLLPPALTFVVFYWATTSFIIKLHDHYRGRFKHMRFFGGFLGATVALKFTDQQIQPNKHFHELVTQPEPRGKYVRTVLKRKHPNMWRKMSSQLHDLGYNFKEMNEYSQRTTMPANTNKHDSTLH